MSQFFSILAISQMLLCVTILGGKAKSNRNIQLFIMLLVCGMAYLSSRIFSLGSDDGIWYWLTYMGGNALPGVFWLVSVSIFSDHFDVKPKHYILASSTLLVPFIATLLKFVIDSQTNESFFKGVGYFATLLELGFISHAIYVSITGWRDDLVQQRRFIRGGVIVFSGVYILQVILLGQLLGVKTVWLDQVESVILVVLLLAINYWLFQLREQSLFSEESIKLKQPDVPKTESKEIRQIIHTMEDECLYQKEGITISELASHLSMHEYKLRNLINGELGYRNFNDFLNHYRIKEVSNKLKDSELATVPVLTFALESGFRSLSSFNKAFKLTHGVTPTEFRKKQHDN